MGGTIIAAQHWSYQLAQAFLCVSYATTNILALRLAIAAGSLCFLLWGALILDISLDTILWNSVFLIINLYQAAKLLAAMYPVKLDEDREKLYQHFFAPGKYFIARADFKTLVSEGQVKVKPSVPIVVASEITLQPASPSARALASAKSSFEMTTLSASATVVATASVEVGLCSIRNYAQGDLISDVGHPAGKALSILLSGRCIVEKLRRGFSLEMAAQQPKEAWRQLNPIRAMEFLDSPEWCARGLDRAQIFEVRVRVTSSTGARVFSWNASALDAILKANASVESCIHGVVGVDLARKVFTNNIERFAMPGAEDVSTTLQEGALQFQPLEKADAAPTGNGRTHDEAYESAPSSPDQLSSEEEAGRLLPHPTGAALAHLMNYAAVANVQLLPPPALVIPANEETTTSTNDQQHSVRIHVEQS